MKKLFTTTFLAFVLLVSSAFSNGLNLNSVGVKAAGMGGAFVGLADDYSAIFWNPAGISNIENPQVAAYFTGVMPTATYKNSMAQVDATTESQMFSVPGLMGYVPISSGFITVGLGIYIPSGLGTTWNGDDLKNLSGGQSYEWMSKVGVVNIAPAVSFQLLPSLSLGAAVNINYGFLDLKKPMMAMVQNRPFFGQYAESSSGWGFGLSVGALFEPFNFLSIGATFKTANKIAFSGTAENDLLKAGLGDNYKDADLERDITWPMWIGGGIAVKPLGLLTVTADVQYTGWSILDKIHTTYIGWKEPENPEKDMEGDMVMNWEDKIQLRFGAEVELLDFMAIRAGYYFDPAPAPDETVNILFPSIDYAGPTFGLAFNFSHLTVEGSVEYLMGTERTITTQTPDNMAGVHNMDIFSFFIGFVWEL